MKTGQILKINLNRLKEAKQIKSTAEVARAIGVIPQVLNSYCEGEIGADKLLKISNFVGRTMNDLVTLQDEPILMLSEPATNYQKSNQNPDNMTELEFLKQQNELLKENNVMQKEKILRLEKELKACQESNRVSAHI